MHPGVVISCSWLPCSFCYRWKSFLQNLLFLLPKTPSDLALRGLCNIMGDSSAGIPVIDFSAYRLTLEKPDSSHFQKLVDDVHSALTTIGFFFVISTDFPMKKVREHHYGIRPDPVRCRGSKGKFAPSLRPSIVPLPLHGWVYVNRVYVAHNKGRASLVA